MYRTFVSGFVMIMASLSAGGEIAAPAVADGYLTADGYGGTNAVYIKFDISSLPSGALIDSALIEVYCAKINPSYAANWGSGFFARVIDQNWNESSSAEALYTAELGAKTRQQTGFKSEIDQKATSTNVGELVSEDMGNDFCTIRIGALDPPFSGDLTVEDIVNTDTLAIGYSGGGEQFKFYSGENSAFAPALKIFYSSSTHAKHHSKLKVKPASNRIDKSSVIYSLSGRCMHLCSRRGQPMQAYAPYALMPDKNDNASSRLSIGQSSFDSDKR